MARTRGGRQDRGDGSGDGEMWKGLRYFWGVGMTLRERPRGTAKCGAGAGEGWWEWETPNQRQTQGHRGGSGDNELATKCRRALVSSCINWGLWWYLCPQGECFRTQTTSTAVVPLPHRWGVFLLGLERTWHVRGWHRSQHLGPDARAGSAVIVGTAHRLWGWPLPGPLPPVRPPHTGPAPQGHWPFPRCHRGRQISGSPGQWEKPGGKTTRNLYPKSIWRVQKWGACDRDPLIKWLFSLKMLLFFQSGAQEALWLGRLQAGMTGGRLPSVGLKETHSFHPADENEGLGPLQRTRKAAGRLQAGPAW